MPAQVENLDAALQALSNAPEEARRMFDLAIERNMALFFPRPPLSPPCRLLPNERSEVDVEPIAFLSQILWSSDESS